MSPNQRTEPMPVPAPRASVVALNEEARVPPLSVRSPGLHGLHPAPGPLPGAADTRSVRLPPRAHRLVSQIVGSRCVMR